AERERISFGAAIDRVDEVPGLATRSLNAVEGFGELMRDLRELAATAGPAEVLGEVLDRTGYLAELRASDDPQDAQRVENLADLERISFGAAIDRVDEVPGLATRSLNAVEGFGELMRDLRELAATAGPAEVLGEVLDRTGYLAELRASDDPQDAQRVENLAE